MCKRLPLSIISLDNKLAKFETTSILNCHCCSPSNLLPVSPQSRLGLGLVYGSKGGAVVRALASHQCGPGSNPGVDAICGLSLLLVLSLAPRGFSPGTPVFPSP